MRKERTFPSLKLYLGGAVLACGPLILLAISLSFFNLAVPETNLAILTLVLAILGGLMGGFIVNDKAKIKEFRDAFLVGGITGLISFLFLLFYFLFTLKGLLLETEVLVGYILGGCLGGTFKHYLK